MSIFDDYEDHCRPSVAGCTFIWNAKGIGFGEFDFYIEGDKIYCINEHTNKDFIKKMLCKMVDDCELEDK